jgi:hypothetical protein
MKALALCALLVLALAGPVFAQPVSVSASSGVSFTPSPSHNETNPDGTPVLTNYTLTIRAQVGGALFITRSLLKPAPSNDNLIVVRPIPEFGNLPQNSVYFAEIQAVGPGGSSEAAQSNPFVRYAPALVPAAPSNARVIP